ncbi:MAG: DUF1997 domain-containing protein [Chlorobiaceae bacterium]|nr:DUF1997 domain-containing protein [Chlorobiaceae bacterium]
MKMSATGVSRGEWIFHGEFDRTVEYLTDQKKILGFNPFCYKVEQTEIDNVYMWHFRVTDPQNNPFDVLFFVEQTDELLVELPDHIDCTDPDELTDEMIRLYTIGRKVNWKHHPAPENIEDPSKYLFEGKAFAEMYLHPLTGNRTKVKFDLRIDVRFLLYPAFRIIPEQVVRKMINTGISLIMQTATNRMFHCISKDFGNRVLKA